MRFGNNYENYKSKNRNCKKFRRIKKKNKKIFFYHKIKSFIDVLNIAYLKNQLESLENPYNLFVVRDITKSVKIYKHCEKARRQGLLTIEYKENNKFGYGITNKGIRFIKEKRNQERNQENNQLFKGK